MSLAGDFQGSLSENDLRRRFEGQLNKFTNVVKGWQYRWFILDPESGRLEYYLIEVLAIHFSHRDKVTIIATFRSAADGVVETSMLPGRSSYLARRTVRHSQSTLPRGRFSRSVPAMPRRGRSGWTGSELALLCTTRWV